MSRKWTLATMQKICVLGSKPPFAAKLAEVRLGPTDDDQHSMGWPSRKKPPRRSRLDALRTLTWDAMYVEMTTHRTHMESINLMRFGKREVEANPDGISVRGPLPEALMLAGMITREGQADANSGEFAQTANLIRAAQDATPAYVTVKTVGNDRFDQIEAGRRWVRLHLAATSVGISMQPLSQALQEYPEQSDLYAQVHEMLAGAGETVQMLGRIGYAAPVGPSPRWSLESRIIGA